MRGLPREDLSLRQQPAADLDFAADAERVDALIASRRLRLRPHHLPVITLRCRGRATARVPVGHADEIELAVAVHVGHG